MHQHLDLGLASLRNCGKMTFCCLSHPACDNFVVATQANQYTVQHISKLITSIFTRTNHTLALWLFHILVDTWYYPSFQIIDIVAGVQQYHTVALICISLIINAVGHQSFQLRKSPGCSGVWAQVARSKQFGLCQFLVCFLICASSRPSFNKFRWQSAGLSLIWIIGQMLKVSSVGWQVRVGAKSASLLAAAE